MPLKLIFALVISLTVGAFNITAQDTHSVLRIERSKAMEFVDENRYLDAFPILEKIAPQLPNDVEVWTYYGIALANRSGTLTSAAQRKAERKKAYDALLRAKQLGTTNVLALSFLDQLSPDGGDDDILSTHDPRVEQALREGEEFFGRGEYNKAFASYEKAYKIDPRNYEALLFMGDSLYAQKKYAESEQWFAKAAAIDRNRETAYRFWGDALLFQDKIKEATEKFIEAFIADPYSRHSWENINKLTRKAGKPFDVKGIFPPGTNGFGAISLNNSEFTEIDGTSLWHKYLETRDLWKRTIFNQQYPNQAYRHSLKEEVAALQAVAKAAKTAIKSGTIKNPHHSISNLITFSDNDLLEPYILFFLSDDGIASDYILYRESNRGRLRQFLAANVFVY